MFEPIFVAKAGTPQYDERFIGYGMTRNTQVTSMEQHVSNIVLIVEGATEKVTKFIMPLKSIYNNNFNLKKQKM